MVSKGFHPVSRLLTISVVQNNAEIFEICKFWHNKEYKCPKLKDITFILLLFSLFFFAPYSSTFLSTVEQAFFSTEAWGKQLWLVMAMYILLCIRNEN